MDLTAVITTDSTPIVRIAATTTQPILGCYVRADEYDFGDLPYSWETENAYHPARPVNECAWIVIPGAAPDSIGVRIAIPDAATADRLIDLVAHAAVLLKDQHPEDVLSDAVIGPPL